MSRLLSGLVAFLPVLAACTVTIDVGGEVTEERALSPFTAVELQGSGEVNFIFDGTHSVTVEAGSNIIDNVRTEVVGDVLELGVEGITGVIGTVRYTVHIDMLTAVSVSGSGEIFLEDFSARELSVDISGSGRVNASGDVTDLERVVTDVLLVDVSGSGRFDGAALATASAEVDIAGSGHVVVRVADELIVSISGSGSVEYIGSPRVTSNVTGSGSVRER